MLAALLLSAGCAADRTHSSSEPLSSKQPSFVSQEQARHLAFAYRRQAADIRELARRIELEALLAGRQSGFSQEESRRLVQAKELFAAAEEADELAFIYRRQVPHGQMQ
jgi:hypothetical protein